MTELATHPPAQLRPHPGWWMFAASMIASITLLMNTTHRHPAMMMLPALIAASYVLHYRLPANLVIAWTVRAIIFGLIFFTAPEGRSVRYWYFEPATIATLGMLLQAELLVRHLLPFTGRMSRGIMLSLTAGILTTGTATTDGRLFAIIAPLYTLAVLGVLRDFRPPLAVSPSVEEVTAPRVCRRWCLHGTAILLALVLGFATASVMVATYRMFGGAGVRLLQQLLPPRESAGMSGNERLMSSWNPTGSTGRTLKINGTSEVMHLRGLAFDKYVYGQWRPTFDRRPFEPVGQLQLPPDAPYITIERLRDVLDILYLPLNTPGFATPPGSTNLIEAGHRQVIQSVTETGEVMVYSVVISRDDFAQGMLSVPLTDEEREVCLEVPEEIEPAVHELAESLRREDPREQIGAIVRHLNDNHRYSLVSTFGQRDPISDFLLNRKAAHCQFFASAAVMLLRINGIPCRYVTGYFAHESTGSASMVVRGRDAHAWVEAWIDGVGWLTVEATPASGTPEGLAEPVGLYQRMKDFLGDLIAAVGNFVRSLRWHHIAITAGSLLLVALVLQAIKSWRMRHKRPRLRAYAFPRAEYQRLATEFEMLLKQLGAPPAGSATWSEHLLAQSAQTHRTGRLAQFHAAQRFVEAYNRNRFGRPDDSNAIHELEALLQEVKDK